MTRSEPSSRRRPVDRSVYRRRRIVAGTIAVLLLAVGIYAPATLLGPLEAASAVVEEPAAIVVDAPELVWPDYGSSAIGSLENTEIFERDGIEGALPLASIAKVVTALVVLDAHPLAPGDEGPLITMSAIDVGYYGRYLALNGKVSAVRSGDVFTQRDLLELTLIESSNNYATSLAVWAYGSEQDFAAAAADWLARHGLDSMRIVEPTGIDSANVGSVADVVALGRIALSDPLVASLVGSPTETVTRLGEIGNTNELLGVDGVNGIKTGTLLSFGANLLFSATVPVGQSITTFIGVVVGGPDHPQINHDILLLLRSAGERLAEIPLVAQGQVLGSYRSSWGETAELIAGESASILVWGDADITARIEADPVTAAAAGTAVGELVFEHDGATVTVPLVLSEDIAEPSAWWRLANPGIVFGLS